MSTGEIVSKDTLDRLTQTAKAIEALMAQEDTPPEELQKALGQIEAKWLDKVESIGHLVKDWEYRADILKAEIERLQAMKKTLESRSQWLKDYCLWNMVAQNEERLQFPMFTVSVRKNPPSVLVLDEKEIPSSYTRVITEIQINKLAIMDHYKKTGGTVKGCQIVTDRKRLEIK